MGWQGLDGIIWLPMGLSPSGRWGPLGQGMVYNSGELSGEFVIEQAGEDTERWIDGWNMRSGAEY